MAGKAVRISTERKIERRDVTGEVARAVEALAIADGFVVVSVPHTTAALTVGENWDPDVGSDMERALARWVPGVRFDHGEGNSPAHFLSEAIGNARLVPVEDGKLRLGRWQGIFFVELDGPRERTLHVDPLARA